MTRREALKLLADARYADDLQGNDDLQTAHIMAMKALEQDSILDKIRAEIVEQREVCAECNSETDLGIAIEIIDKYREGDAE